MAAKIKTSLQGQITLVDKNTGEILPVVAIEKSVPSSLKGGWRRVYLEQFMVILSRLYSSARKLDVVEYILDNLDYENKFTMTQEQVANELKVSRQTIVETFKVLRGEGFMIKTGLCYTISPEYVCAMGSDAKNANILLKIRKAEEELFDENNDLKKEYETELAQPAQPAQPAAKTKPTKPAVIEPAQPAAKAKAKAKRASGKNTTKRKSA